MTVQKTLALVAETALCEEIGQLAASMPKYAQLLARPELIDVSPEARIEQLFEEGLIPHDVFARQDGEINCSQDYLDSLKSWGKAEAFSEAEVEEWRGDIFSNIKDGLQPILLNEDYSKAYFAKINNIYGSNVAWVKAESKIEVPQVDAILDEEIPALQLTNSPVPTEEELVADMEAAMNDAEITVEVQTQAEIDEAAFEELQRKAAEKTDEEVDVPALIETEVEVEVAPETTEVPQEQEIVEVNQEDLEEAIAPAVEDQPIQEPAPTETQEESAPALSAELPIEFVEEPVTVQATEPVVTAQATPVVVEKFKNRAVDTPMANLAMDVDAQGEARVVKGEFGTNKRVEKSYGLKKDKLNFRTKKEYARQDDGIPYLSNDDIETSTATGFVFADKGGYKADGTPITGSGYVNVNGQCYRTGTHGSKINGGVEPPGYSIVPTGFSREEAVFVPAIFKCGFYTHLSPVRENETIGNSFPSPFTVGSLIKPILILADNAAACVSMSNLGNLFIGYVRKKFRGGRDIKFAVFVPVSATK